jgi:hypothetical protein
VNQTLGEFMLRFNDVLARSGSGRIMMDMDMGRPLASDAKVSDDESTLFCRTTNCLTLRIATVLINRDMAYDAFSYELEKALSDPRVR